MFAVRLMILTRDFFVLLLLLKRSIIALVCHNSYYNNGMNSDKNSNKEYSIILLQKWKLPPNYQLIEKPKVYLILFVAIFYCHRKYF